MKRIFFALGLLFFVNLAVYALDSRPLSGIRVGVSEMPPYVVFKGDQVAGVSADLWRNITDSLHIQFTFVRFSNYIDLLDKLEKGDVDITINPMTLTDSRLIKLRLTIPFYTSRLGLAEPPSSRIPLVTVFLSLMNWRTLQLIILLCLIILVFAILIWLAERRKNQEEFRKNHSGLGDGFWWAFVTMTTVGYGDKVPKTTLGKTLTMIWMFYAVILMFVFTAEISSELTITKLQGNISNIEDLRKIKVGTLEQTGFASFCQVNHIQYTSFTDIMEGLKAVTNHEIEAFVGDVATLEFLFNKYKLGRTMQITPTSLNEQYFCFGATRDHLDLIDQINPVLLNVTESAEWVEILYENGIAQ